MINQPYRTVYQLGLVILSLLKYTLKSVFLIIQNARKTALVYDSYLNSSSTDITQFLETPTAYVEGL